MGYANPEVDAAFVAARRTTDPAARRGFYCVAAERWQADRTMLILYSHRWSWGLRAGLEEFEPAPDGLVRFGGLRVPH